MRASYFQFTADIPPSINHLYYSAVVQGRCRRFMKSEGKSYKEALGWAAKAAAGECGWEYQGGPIRFVMQVVYPDRRRRDITNGIKIVEDAVAEALDFDDRVVDSFLVQKSGMDKENPHIHVTVTEVDSPRPPEK